MRKQEPMTSHGLLAKAIFAEIIQERIIERKFTSPAVVRHLSILKKDDAPCHEFVWGACTYTKI